MDERRAHARFRLEPGTGKAIELRRGMILRIEQIEGGQCVDFNCFNLHDYNLRCPRKGAGGASISWLGSHHRSWRDRPA